MIARLGATVGAVTPVAAYAIEKAKVGGAIVQAPVVWSFLGFPFEAACMISALFGCLAARYWIGAGQAAKKQFRFQLDLPVSALALSTSAGVIMNTHLSPITALGVGAGIGIIGEGLFKIAEKQAEAFGFTPKDPPTA